MNKINMQDSFIKINIDKKDDGHVSVGVQTSLDGAVHIKDIEQDKSGKLFAGTYAAVMSFLATAKMDLDESWKFQCRLFDVLLESIKDLDLENEDPLSAFLVLKEDGGE